VRLAAAGAASYPFLVLPAAFVPAATVPPIDPADAGVWFVFHGAHLLVRPASAAAPLPAAAELALRGAELEEAVLVGTLAGAPCRALARPADAAVPPGLEAAGLRGLFGRLPEELWQVAGRAMQLLEFARTHRLCGACGTPTTRVPGEHSRRCPACTLTVYPRVAPAIIVLVRRGDEALLAHGPKFPASFFSTLAGFVEPGESLEETLDREVREEAGIEVANPRYFGSQPWPFPHSLMVGFTADYAGGDLRVDGVEIGEARWFRADALPPIPPRVSIARALIDAWVAEVRGRRP
jgi:NAD+ diphosphatase